MSLSQSGSVENLWKKASLVMQQVHGSGKTTEMTHFRLEMYHVSPEVNRAVRIKPMNERRSNTLTQSYFPIAVSCDRFPPLSSIQIVCSDFLQRAFNLAHDEVN